MIPGTIPIAGGSFGPPTIAYLTNLVDTSDETTYSFGGVSFGDAAADRAIAVTIHGTRSVASREVSSVTIGGVSASRLVGQTTFAGALAIGTVSEIWIASVPAGTSGTVSITFNDLISHCAVGVFRITGLLSLLAEGTAVGQANNNSNNLSLTGVSKDAVVIACGTATGSPTFGYTGVTQEYENAWSDTSGRRFTGGSGVATSAGSFSITQTNTGGANVACVSVALR